jgi:hypothetical protein
MLSSVYVVWHHAHQQIYQRRPIIEACGLATHYMLDSAAPLAVPLLRTARLPLGFTTKVQPQPDQKKLRTILCAAYAWHLSLLRILVNRPCLHAIAAWV